jgi:hypothetical protein
VTDLDGDTITVRVTGAGSADVFITDPDGDGKGPIEWIQLTGTDPAKTNVGLTTKKVGDGLVNVGAVTGTGVRNLNFAKATLNGTGIDLTGSLQSLQLAAISGGADISAVGVIPKKSTKIAVKGAIADGTDIDVDMPLSLTAASVGTGQWDLASIRSVNVKGNFGADVNVSGAGVEPGKPAVNGFTVKGAVNGSVFNILGDVNKLSVGDFLNSSLFAGYAGPDNGVGGVFTGNRTIKAFTSKGTFGNSSVIASTIGTVNLGTVTVANGANGEFGVFADTSIKTVNVKTPKQKLKNETNFVATDFSVKVV